MRWRSFRPIRIEYDDEYNPDLIVMGAKGEGLLGGLLGSVAANVVHSGRWPVLIVRSPYRGIKRVLLVTDGSPASISVISWVHLLCQHAPCSVLVVRSIS